jgi:hypothetical protein
MSTQTGDLIDHTVDLSLDSPSWLAGGVISYKSKYQQTIALSSTKAEFTATAKARKLTLYLSSNLHELGFHQDLATIIFEDNTGALHMVNVPPGTPVTWTPNILLSKIG